MGARQSTAEERPRSNSVDVASPSSSDHHHHAVSSSMTPAELLEALRQSARIGSSSDSNEDEEPSSSAHRSLRNRVRGVSHSHHPPSFRVRSQTGRRSVPLFMLASEDLQCPICHKTVPSDQAEIHFVMCLTRPRLSYNDDILKDDKGECSICFEEMEAGQTIARLPCLCIYHKTCIDDWFKYKDICPQHPGDD